MALFREPDPLTDFLTRTQRSLLASVEAIGNGEGSARVAEVRRLLSALDDAESTILSAAFGRVTLDVAIERLLEDARGERGRQLEKLEALALKRAPRLRKLGAVALADAIEHHHRACLARSIPVLASRLPRPVYRAVASAFIARVEQAAGDEAPRARATVDRAPVLDTTNPS